MAQTKPIYGRGIDAPYYKGEKERVQAGLTLSKEDREKYDNHREFDNLNSKEKQDRIAQIKDPHNNPLTMSSGYDGLVSGYHKWTLVAADALKNKISGEAQDRIADNYYDRMLVPLYQKAGMTPISRELWKREAWAKDGALTFDVDDRYINGGAAGFVRGLVNTVQLGENVAETGVNLLGFGLKEGWAAAKAGAKGQFFETDEGSWIDNLHKVAQQNPDMFEAAKKDTRSIPILRSLSKVLDDRTGQFWSESIPARNAVEWTTGQATELAAQAGVFKALGKVNEAGIVATGLTDALTKVPAGKFILKSLMAGAEGSTFGLLTRPQEDKHKWLEDGISWMAMSMLFAGLGKAGSAWVERFKASGGMDVLGEKASQFGDRFKNKVRPLNGGEKDAQALGAKANEIAAVGATGSEAIDEHAIRVANDWAEKGLNSKQIAAEKRRLLHPKKGDPALYNRVFAGVDNINRIIGKEPILDIMEDPAKLANLKAKLKLMRNDAADRMVESVDEVQQSALKDAMKDARSPGAAKRREQIKADLMNPEKHPDIIQALKHGNITPEEIERRVDELYAQESVKGGIESAKQARKVKNATEDAAAVSKKREAIKAVREAAGKAGTDVEAAKADVEAKAKPKVEPKVKAKGETGTIVRTKAEYEALRAKEAKPAATAPTTKRRGTLRNLGWSDGAIDRMSPEEAQKIASEGRKPEPMEHPEPAATEQPELATKGLKSEVARPVPTTAQETRGAFGGGVTSGLMHRRAIDAAWKSFSDALLPEFKEEMKSGKIKLKKGGWEKEFDDFLKDHMIGMEDHDLSELLHNFLPPEMGPYARDIFFEKGKAGENPNLLAFLTNYKPMLPPAVREVIGDKLAESVKVHLALPGNKPLTQRAERFYARIIYNHVDNLLGSENVRLLGERNVFKSSGKEMREQTEWMAESIQDRHNQDREDLQEMFSHNPEMMQNAVSTLDNIYESLYKLNKEVFNGKFDPNKAEKWKAASDELADWMIQQSNLPESKMQLDKWNIDYEHAETYKWQRVSQDQ